MLELENCCLVVVDVQGKLASLMYEKEILFDNIKILIKAAGVLDIPVVWAEQCPESLGETISEVAGLLDGCEPVKKATFSCCGDEGFISAIRSLQRCQVLVCGIEAHVCVYQTAVDLSRYGWQPYVVADAVSSRTSQNRDYALDIMQAEQIKLTTTEMALFELLKSAEHPHFKTIVKLVK